MRLECAFFNMIFLEGIKWAAGSKYEGQTSSSMVIYIEWLNSIRTKLLEGVMQERNIWKRQFL